MSQSDPPTRSADRADGFVRVARLLRALGHPHEPLWLDAAVRTARQAAQALGVQTGQIAKSIVFRRRADCAAVLAIAAGDRRIDEASLAALDGELERAVPAFVKQRTGYSIGGVAPIGHATPLLIRIDAGLFRFDTIWAAAGHPNGVFELAPQDLLRWTRAPVVDIAASADGAERLAVPAPAVPSPCIQVCRIDTSGRCAGCLRTLDEIAAWPGLDDDGKRAIWRKLQARRAERNVDD